MGKSGVSGWGAFLHAPARAGDLLGEYTGELISQAEADRRWATVPPRAPPARPTPRPPAPWPAWRNACHLQAALRNRTGLV